MDIKVTQKKDNPLLNRQEVEGELGFDKATPSNKELGEALAKQFNVAAELVVVKHIYGKFGGMKATFTANIYKTADDLKKSEPPKRVKAAAAPAAK